MDFTGKRDKSGLTARATLRDVATRAGVSHMTVSNVVNARIGVVQEGTRLKVLAAMRELDYHPSSVARGLSKRRMNTLGVALPHGYVSPFSHSYFSPILDGIAEVALRRNQNLTLFTGHVWRGADRSLSDFRDDRCDGLLLLTPARDSDIVTELHRVGLKFVVIGDTISEQTHPGVSSVNIDDRAAQFEMTSHVLRAGHRRVAVLLGNTHVAAVHRRLQGHYDALNAWEVAPDARLILEGEFVEPTISQRIDKLLALPDALRPTAVCCTNDDMALVALQALRERGIAVPDDLSVVGFDDIPGAATARPALTTMRQPIREIGVTAAEILLDLIDGDQPRDRMHLLPTSMVVRESLAPPRIV